MRTRKWLEIEEGVGDRRAKGKKKRQGNSDWLGGGCRLNIYNSGMRHTINISNLPRDPRLYSHVIAKWRGLFHVCLPPKSTGG